MPLSPSEVEAKRNARNHEAFENYLKVLDGRLVDGLRSITVPNTYVRGVIERYEYVGWDVEKIGGSGPTFDKDEIMLRFTESSRKPVNR